MVTFVVPPLASKSDYYDLSVVRETWQWAREALTGASRLVFMGYSAPLTDLSVAALLSHYAAGDVPCVVADTAPDGVVDRLHRFGLDRAQAFLAEKPVSAFAKNYEATVSGMVAKALVPLLPQFEPYGGEPVVARIVGDTFEPRRPVIRIVVEGDSTVLVAHNWQPNEDVADLAIKCSELLNAVRAAADAARRVVVRLPNDPDRAVLNIALRVYHRNLIAVEA
jgi:hypothetical protein